MQRVLLFPLAILLQLNAVLELFLVLICMVIDPVTNGTLKTNEIVLGHKREMNKLGAGGRI